MSRTEAEMMKDPIFHATLDAMQAADEIGGVADTTEYIGLHQAIATTCLERIETAKETARAANIATLADTFASMLRRDLTPAQYLEVRRRNRVYADQAGGEDFCASHQFIDSNMTMAEAFEAVMGREPDVGGDTPASDADIELWNAAWSRAYHEYLTADVLVSQPVGPSTVDTVRAKLSTRWLCDLIDDQILAIEADSCVGAAVVDLCAKADALLDIRTADADSEEDSCVEEDFVCSICEAVSDQANVWYFG